MLHCRHFRDRIPQSAKLLENCDDLGHHVLVNDELAAVDLAVETYVVDLGPAQLRRFHGATRSPAGAELCLGDCADGGGGRDRR